MLPGEHYSLEETSPCSLMPSSITKSQFCNLLGEEHLPAPVTEPLHAVHAPALNLHFAV